MIFLRNLLAASRPHDWVIIGLFFIAVFSLPGGW